MVTGENRETQVIADLQQEPDSSPCYYYTSLPRHKLIRLTCKAKEMVLVVKVITTIRTDKEKAVAQESLIVNRSYTTGDGCIKTMCLMLHPTENQT